MIIFNISGGLGNQFFQYAFGRYLSNKAEETLLINIKSYEKDTQREFALKFFNTSYDVLSQDDILAYLRPYLRLSPRLRSLYRKFCPTNWKVYFENLGFSYDFSVKNATQGYFYGYWAHEGYFNEIEDILREEFTLRKEYRSGKLKREIEKACKNNSIAVHIRRGDYVNNSILAPLKKDYYENAVRILNTKIKDPIYYIFSDDTSWVKKNLNLPVRNMVYASDLNLLYDYEEFELMRSCKNFIIANSTFSWWAAWLSENSDKTVLLPKKWYAKDDYNFFCPSDWIRI